jgi:ATP-dependent helicase YprA (DUF1998 family)
MPRLAVFLTPLFYMQRVGRAGRTLPSLVVFVPSGSAFDEFVLRNPEALLTR